MVTVPDSRLEWLRDRYQPKKFTPAVIEFVDIAGLVKGASKGEGLGNKFLSNIRTTDAIVHVVRCFDDPNVTHVEGSTDQAARHRHHQSGADLCRRRDGRAPSGQAGKRPPRAATSASCARSRSLPSLKSTLNEGKLARTFACSDDDRALIATSDLLTLKKRSTPRTSPRTGSKTPRRIRIFKKVRALADAEGSEVIPICAKLEADIAELDDPEEKAMFMEELGLKRSGLDRLIQASYELLGLISFLTAGSDECRAWTIKKGHEGAAGGRKDPHGFRARLHPRRGHRL